MSLPIELFFLSMDHKLKALINELKISVGDENLYIQNQEMILPVGDMLTAISNILSFLGVRPVISQSIHTSGPALKPRGADSADCMLSNEENRLRYWRC